MAYQGQWLRRVHVYMYVCMKAQQPGLPLLQGLHAFLHWGGYPEDSRKGEHFHQSPLTKAFLCV